MKKSALMNRILAFCLTLVIASGFLITSSSAATVNLSDIKGHWAEQAIRYGVDAGYISGYTDGTFKPNRTVTRAQFTKMLNNAIGLSNTVTISFTDVPSTLWCYDEICKAVSAQYINGYEDGTFKPDNTITRLQAAVMLSRVVTRPTSVTSSTSFVDSAKIPDWARDNVDVVYTKGYMKGDEKNKFNPYNFLTRAQAAQLIYQMLQGENIVSSSTTITNAANLSNVLYANNVTINAAVGTESVSFKNCRILGALAVNGGSLVTVADTGINYLAAVREDAQITATGKASIQDTIVRNGVTLQESSLSGDGFKNVTLTGTDLESSTVKLVGSFDMVDVQTSTVLNHSSGTVAKMELSAKSNTMVQKGTITALTVDSAAAGSTVTLASGVKVGTATMNGAATFYGEGTIDKAVENVTGVTYTTQPGSITTGSNNGNNDKPTTGVLNPTVVPANGTSGVDVGTSVSLVFDEAIYNASGKAVTSAYASDSVVELRQNGTMGTTVACSVSVSGKTITLTPSADLAAGTTYYVVVKAGSLKNAEGKTNTAFNSSFTTKTVAAATLTPSFSPANGASGISVSSDVTLAFSDVLFNASGNTLTNSYVEGSVVELRQGSATGSLVSYTAYISSDRKTITVSPDSDLSANTTYYVVVNASKLQNANGNTNPRSTSSFTTGTSATLTPTVSPVNGATYVSKTGGITLSFNEQVYEKLGVTLTSSYVRDAVVELHKDSVDGAKVAFTANIGNNKQSITILPTVALADNTTYYLVVNKGTLVNAGGSYNSRFVSKFSTGSNVEADIAFSPANGATAVVTTGTIQVTFPAVVYRSGYTSLKNSYLEGTAIELRKDSISGTKVDFSASMASDGKTVTLTPTSDLDTNTRYYVVIVANTLEYTDGSTVAGANAYFTTEDSNPITVTVDSAALTGTSASFTVKTAVPGKMTISYSGGGKSSTLVSNVMMQANGSRTLNLSGLSVGTTYTVYATLVYNGLNYTRSQSFTTTSSSLTTTLKEMRLVDGADEYSIIDSASTQATFTVNPAASTNAKLVMLPAESNVSGVEYRIGNNTNISYTPLSKGSDGYYTLTGLKYAKGETVTVQLRVTAENTSYTRLYTVNIVCNY